MTKEDLMSLRAHLGCSQAELAARIGTDQSTISRWEAGITRPEGPAAILLNIIARDEGLTFPPVSALPERAGAAE